MLTFEVYVKKGLLENSHSHMTVVGITPGSNYNKIEWTDAFRLETHGVKVSTEEVARMYRVAYEAAALSSRPSLQ